jgi:TRAP-type C4-dicarboxylate transport system permease small subunit
MPAPEILKRQSLGTVTMLLVLLILLIGAVKYAVTVWTSKQAVLPPFIWVALAACVFFMLLVGIGLMVLVFYSSRAGYDEAPEIAQNTPDTSRDASLHPPTTAPDSSSEPG